MFDNLGHWTWITLAWGQVVLAYVIYLLYLRRMERRIREGEPHE
ncbi:MAG: hypothetical protein WDA03_02545 [Trueperaceae bacterium]